MYSAFRIYTCDFLSLSRSQHFLHFLQFFDQVAYNYPFYLFLCNRKEYTLLFSGSPLFVYSDTFAPSTHHQIREVSLFLTSCQYCLISCFISVSMKAVAVCSNKLLNLQIEF